MIEFSILNNQLHEDDKIMNKTNKYLMQIIYMLIPCVLIGLSSFIAWPVFLFAVIEVFILRYIFLVIIILNIISFLAVEGDKTGIGVFLSTFGGFIGGFIAANTSNKYFDERQMINRNFITQLFIFVIYPLEAYALFEFDIHGMLM